MTNLRAVQLCRVPAGVLLLLVVSGCARFGAPVVERAERGERWQGRYIPVAAYAWYARAASFEGRGQLDDAESAYLEAASADPESGSIWAHIGALRCAQKRDDAEEAFDRAMDTGNDGAVVLTLRGRCALVQGRFEDALDDGRAAVQRDPRLIGASLLVVGALRALGRSAEASRYMNALAARYPNARIVQEEQRELARQNGDVFRAQLAIEALDPEGDSQLAARGHAALDLALMDEDLDLARKRAIVLGVSGSELALRAIALGTPTLAVEQADLVLAASPEDGDARIALLVALERTAQFERLNAVLAQPVSAPAESLLPLAVLLFGELLEHRSGAEAARAWRAAHPVAPSSDPLLERVRARAP